MKDERIIEGVVAEYDGQYWGVLYADGHSTEYGYGSLQTATISDPVYCKTPTGMTWSPTNDRRNPDYEKLLNAQLVPVKMTITIETV